MSCALRFIDHGNLPLPTEFINYERKKLEEKAKYKKLELGYEMTLWDLYELAREVKEDVEEMINIAFSS